MKRPSLLLIVLVGILAPLPSVARDHVLTIGGGFSPAGNQVSLERNVIFFRKLLAEKLPAAGHDLYFADGNSPQADLQFTREGDEVPRANLLMAGLFGSEEGIGNAYRDHALESVRGTSSPEEVEKWFRETGAGLTDGDRLILYVTAHGGRSGQKDNKHNTKIFMWNRRSMEASKLAGLIDGLPEGVSVMTVMVQCYSGGFSHLVFEENNTKKGDSQRSICGFFSTVCDREAAGCTPDVNEENYDEFSSHFWAALRGKTRMGQAVASTDYDRDGRVSFEEAHAYAILTSRNIDVPVKTSDAFLRAHSKLEEKGTPGLATPWSELLGRARPVERVVMEGLSKELGLGGEGRGLPLKKKTETLAKELKELVAGKKAQKKTLDAVRKGIAQDIRNRWPELSNMYSPGAQRLLAAESDSFVKSVGAHGKYQEWQKLLKEREEFEEKELVLSRSYALHARLLRALENVVLASNLEKIGDAEKGKRYARLLEAEQGGFGG
ncbi:MAG: hypothetical protein OSA48_08310 [Akkermansiaceae bacterium]|nr:hypothetical protein [Akkermansiaceae bacterium]